MKKPLIRNVRLRDDQRTGSPLRRLEQTLLRNRPLNIFASHAITWTLTALLWPRFVAPYRWHLTRHPLLLAADPILNGYRILQLSDLHLGKTRLSYLLKVAKQSLAEKPDLIVITGDLIDYSPAALAPVQEFLSQLTTAAAGKVPDGIIAIFGNHDYHEYSWRHIGPRSAHRAIHKRLVAIVEKSGVRLLRNQQARITRQRADGTAAHITLVGLDEMWTGRADADKAFEGLSPAEPVICLQHNPDGIAFLEKYPWQFMLCGHSHGGQANFPFFGAIYLPMENRHLLQGHFHFPLLPGQPEALRQRTMFVSRGLGHSTPIRLRCPPEATLFTISTTS